MIPQNVIIITFRKQRSFRSFSSLLCKLLPSSLIYFMIYNRELQANQASCFTLQHSDILFMFY